MEDKRIYIFHGSVHVGKTTALQSWIQGRKDIGGIIAPDVNGKRILISVSTGESIVFQVKEDDGEIFGGNLEPLVTICDYKFKQSAFDWANKEITTQFFTGGFNWIVVDEIGPLELKRKEGLASAMSEVLERRNETKTKLLVIVRSSMVDLFIETYKLDPSEVAKISDLNNF
jgi:nucleoside-triphosphatase THEP1